MLEYTVLTRLIHSCVSAWLQLVHLHFTAFDVEPGPGDCSYDSVKVYDGDTLVNTFCGSNIPGDLTAPGNTLRVTFTSDISVAGGGFRVEYSAKKVVAPGKRRCVCVCVCVCVCARACVRVIFQHVRQCT